MGEVWIYKDLSGEEAIQQKLQDLFLHINKLRFTDVIDTIQINKDSSNRLYIGNSGVNGDLWPFQQRIETYKKYIHQYNLNLLLEIEFPTAVTINNVSSYAAYAAEVINAYPWVKYWQIMTEPESYDSAGIQKCPPHLYVRLIKYIYETIHTKYHDIKIGGPGICEGIAQYVNSQYMTVDGDVFHTGWLARATGEYYGIEPDDNEIGPSGFLKYIDFFAFQGKQDYNELNYNIYQEIITKLRSGLITQAQRDNHNFDVDFLSTSQGHFAETGNYNDLQLQAFRDLREFINAFKVHVVPFKKQLVDEFYDPNDVSAEKNVYGLLYYFLGNNFKPAYSQYKFLLQHLIDYTQLADNTYYLNNKRPFILTDQLHYIMLMNSDKSMLGTIIFPAIERQLLVKTPSYTTVTLKPAANRNYYLPDGTHGVITEPIDITFKNYDFVFIEEAVTLDVSVSEKVLDEAAKRLQLYSSYAQEIMTLVPDDYVKDIYDGLNFPKLLRAIAVELGDTEYERQILEDNMYLATAHGDAIYNNFGAMISVPWRKDWDEERYRTVVSALIESLLKGATKSSIEKALRTFTTFDVHIFELFKDYKHYGMTQDMHYQNQYSFVVEVEKDIDSGIDTDTLYEDIRFVTDIVRPAHTIPIIMVVLVGKEEYGDWYENKYGIPWKDSDIDTWDILTFEESNKFGWKAEQYDLVIHPNRQNLNSGYVIGPKYTLHDIDWWNSNILYQEYYDTPKTRSQWESWSYFAADYDRVPKEDIHNTSLLTLIENKFGIRPLDNTLQTNIKNLWGNDYVHTRRSLLRAAPITTDNDPAFPDYVTGFEYLLDDNDHWHIFGKYAEAYTKAKEELLIHSYINDFEDVKEPIENWNIAQSIFLSELPFRYRYDDLLRSYSHYANTYLNAFKTAIAPRLFEECHINTAIHLEEQMPTPQDDLINNNIVISEIAAYEVKKDEQLLSQDISLCEHSFKYRDNHALKTFNHYNDRCLNLATTAFAIKLYNEENVTQQLLCEESYHAIKDSCTIKIFKITTNNEQVIEEVTI